MRSTVNVNSRDTTHMRSGNSAGRNGDLRKLRMRLRQESRRRRNSLLLQRCSMIRRLLMRRRPKRNQLDLMHSLTPRHKLRRLLKMKLLLLKRRKNLQRPVLRLLQLKGKLQMLKK